MAEVNLRVVLLVVHDALELGLEPLNGVLLCDTVLHAHFGKSAPPPGHPVASALQDNVEVHTCSHHHHHRWLNCSPSVGSNSGMQKCPL